MYILNKKIPKLINWKNSLPVYAKKFRDIFSSNGISCNSKPDLFFYRNGYGTRIRNYLQNY